MNKSIKTIVSLFVASVLLGSCTQSIRVKEDAALIPLPQEMSLEKSCFVIYESTTIGVDPQNEELVSIANYLKNKLAPATGYALTVAETGDIQLMLSENAELGDEGYHLDVKSNQITVTAQKPAGIFYGIQTLLQLMPKEIKAKELQTGVNWTVQCTTITDSPKFAWRGLMLDVSRHWFTKEEVMRMIDEMAEYKMNVFHWHLTDDQGWRIQIDAFPKLTEVGAWRAPRVGDWWSYTPQQEGEKATYGGFYTKDEIKEVLAYAKERHIRVIPEVDVPGHSLAALVAYPELACMNAPKFVNVGNKFYGEDENTLCIGKEVTFEFLEKVFKEVAELFPDEYIHIGGDECFKGFWHKCPRCQARMRAENLKNEEELQSYFIHRLEGILKKMGKKIIGWDEIIEGGLAPEATVMSWRGMEGGIKAAKANHHVIMTPQAQCYIDLYQGEPTVEPLTYSMCRLSDSYSFNPVPDSVPAEMVLGGQGNLWAESIPTFRHAEYMLWPRGWAIAEVLWSGAERADWNQFWPRVEKHFERAEAAEINYARSMYNAIITPKMTDNGLQIELSCEIADSDIYYTFDNTDPDKFTAKYTEPLSVPKDASTLNVITYRNGKPSGKLIKIKIEELNKRAKHG